MVRKIILWILTLSCALTIFIFSSQEGEVSNNLSMSITTNVIETMPKTKELTETQKQTEIINTNDKTRKLAHVTVFMLLGIFVYLLLKSYQLKYSFILAFGICVVYSVFDESHQKFFSPGRSFQFVDLVKDWVGSLIGILGVKLSCKLLGKNGKCKKV